MEKEIPKRKTARLKNWNYSSAGVYFITICTQNRKNVLSSIVGEGLPLPQLSPYGKIADKWIKQIKGKYESVCVDCYTIMPNHIHLLLSLSPIGRGNPSPTIDSIVGWLKFQITKEINEQSATVGKKVFQRSFYDHIIRSQEDYNEIYEYIKQNPLRWKIDKLYVK